MERRTNLTALLKSACQKNYPKLVKFLLMHPEIDPSAQDNDAIRWASIEGHLEVVECLLKDKRVDPSAEDNAALRLASANGHLKVVECLLKDKRVDPSAQDNDVFRFASKYGYVEVVECLLKDKRVDPSAQDNEAIRVASGRGHLEVVECLLKDKRVNPSAKDNAAIRLASFNSHVEVVQRLLKDKRVDPSAALRMVSRYGHLEVVECLLKDKRVDPSAQDNDAIRGASFFDHLKVVTLFLTCKKLDLKAQGDAAIRACGGKPWREKMQKLCYVHGVPLEKRLTTKYGDIPTISSIKQKLEELEALRGEYIQGGSGAAFTQQAKKNNEIVSDFETLEQVFGIPVCPELEVEYYYGLFQNALRMEKSEQMPLDKQEHETVALQALAAIPSESKYYLLTQYRMGKFYQMKAKVCTDEKEQERLNSKAVEHFKPYLIVQLKAGFSVAGLLDTRLSILKAPLSTLKTRLEQAGAYSSALSDAYQDLGLEQKNKNIPQKKLDSFLGVLLNTRAEEVSSAVENAIEEMLKATLEATKATLKARLNIMEPPEKQNNCTTKTSKQHNTPPAPPKRNFSTEANPASFFKGLLKSQVFLNNMSALPVDERISKVAEYLETLLSAQEKTIQNALIQAECTQAIYQVLKQGLGIQLKPPQGAEYTNIGAALTQTI